MNPSNTGKELEKIYDCRFCDGKKRIWDTKKSKYIKCPHTIITDKLEAYVNAHYIEKTKVVEALEDEDEGDYRIDRYELKEGQTAIDVPRADFVTRNKLRAEILTKLNLDRSKK